MNLSSNYPKALYARITVVSKYLVYLKFYKDNTMISYIIYISEAQTEFHTSDLIKILQNSKANNSKCDISGILLYIERRHNDWQGGRFIQLLEGPLESVNKIYGKIEHDNRHKNLVALQRGNAEARLFPNWSMGFETIDEDIFTDKSGLFSLEEKFLDNMSENNKGLRLNYLKSFYNIGRDTDEL